MANSDGSPSDYEKVMLDLFVERFNESYHTEFGIKDQWKYLAVGVQDALRAAFFKTADDIQGDMY